MSTTSGLHDDKARHDRWLESQIAHRRSPVKFEEVSPTYVIRLSVGPEHGVGYLYRSVLGALRGMANGADIGSGTGLWKHDAENSVTVTVQATNEVLRDVLRRLATINGIRWAHVEKHDVPTSYVDLDLFR